MTHIVGASSTLTAIAHIASVAGAVPLTLSNVLTVSILTAAAVFLHKHKYNVQLLKQDNPYHYCKHFFI